MNQLAVVDDIAKSMSDVENIQKMAALLMKTPHYAKMGSEGIFAVISQAKSLGMNPIEALNGGLYYVQGKVGMTAETMSRLIRQRGHSISKDVKSDDTVCILHGKRADTGDTWTIRFSTEDAKRAGLFKNMYEKYPSAMLYNRAMSFLARQLFADVIKGAGYTLEELKEISANDHFVPSDKMPQEDVEVLKVSDDQAAELLNIILECSQEYQTKLWSTLKSPPIGVENLEQLPLNLYERIKNAALKKREEHKNEFQVAV